MNTDQQYLYFDELSNTWLPATLSQIVALNNPDLGICPLNADGTPGPQTTYAALMKKTAAQNNWSKPTTASAHTGAQSPRHTSPLSPDTERNINYTCNYLRATLSVLIFLLFSSAGATLADPRNPEIGLLIGLALGLAAVIILTLISKPSTQK